MMTRKQLNRIVSTLVFSLTLTITLIFGITPVGVSQTAVTNLDTSPESGTRSNFTSGVVNNPGFNDPSNVTYFFGEGDNLILNGFTSSGDKFDLLQLVDEIKLQRVDQPMGATDQVTGKRQLLFFERKDIDKSNNELLLRPSAADNSGSETLMQDALLSNIINRGTDNIFANQGNGSGNNNNIERVDFIAPNGLSAPDGENVGFLVLERGGNDDFGIAPIISLDGNGDPDGYGTFTEISKTKWGKSGEKIVTDVLRKKENETNLKFTANVGSQNIASIFFSYDSLDINNNEEFFGYSLFPGDVDSNNYLVALDDFPTNTSAGSDGAGGLDLVASGGVFILEGIERLDVSVTKEVTKIDDSTSNLDRANLGDEITYKITVINNDTSITANEYNVTDTFPNELNNININWNCEPDPNATADTDCNPNDTDSDASGTGDIDETVNIAPGESVIYTVTATVDPDAIGTETISNTAKISATSQVDSDTSNNSATVEISINPRVRLIKRITAINGGTNSNGGDNLTDFTNDNDDDNDNNDVNWPTDKNIFLAGGINGGEIEPGDELEYTIYFLSDGGQAARNVRICDLITENQTFVRDAFNAEPGVTNNSGIAALIRENKSFFTNIGGDDQGTFLPAGSNPPSECKKVKDNGDLVNLTANDNKDGVVVVDVVEGSDTLLPATSAGEPSESYGFIRFRTKVDEVFNDDQKRQDKQTQKQEN